MHLLRLMELREDEKIGVIGIENGKLAIFGSRYGFEGPVIKQYEPFDDEAEAIESAKITLRELGYMDEPEICRPRITSMRTSTARVRKSRRNRGL